MGEATVSDGIYESLVESFELGTELATPFGGNLSSGLRLPRPFATWPNAVCAAFDVADNPPRIDYDHDHVHFWVGVATLTHYESYAGSITAILGTYVTETPILNARAAGMLNMHLRGAGGYSFRVYLISNTGYTTGIASSDEPDSHSGWTTQTAWGDFTSNTNPNSMLEMGPPVSYLVNPSATLVSTVTLKAIALAQIPTGSSTINHFAAAELATAVVLPRKVATAGNSTIGVLSIAWKFYLTAAPTPSYY
jgi:hypothetical protein